MTQPQPEGRRSGPVVAWTALAAIAALYALALWRAQPPSVVPADGPRGSFRGERALADLARIEGGGRPHPIGSAENARVRDVIVAAFRAAGLTAEVDERLAIGWNGVVAITRNVVARLPGRDSTRSVLVCAHHDSVSAGPGTSDDGAGVAAALEIARVLAEIPERKNDVVFLIDDGEEAGLIGAGSFLAHHPLARGIGVVVNMEARGTTGRAHMFETSDMDARDKDGRAPMFATNVGNGALVAALARGAPSPSATSVAFELYKRMPNDTDMTVFKRAGLAGLNFAFIGGIARYHTPLDDVAHLDPRSLQHIGESALGAVRELVGMDLEHLESGNAVYADVLGFGLIHFPVGWILPLAVAALLVLAWSARRVDRKRFARELAAIVCGFGAAIGAAWAIAGCVTTAHDATYAWGAQPGWTRVAVLLGTLVLGAWITRLVSGNRDGAAPTRHAAHVLYGVLGVVVALTLPSASYLFVFPALAAAVAAPFGARAHWVGVFLPLVVAGVFTLPVLIGVEDGFPYGAPVGAVVGCVLVLAAPALVGRVARPLLGAGLVALICLVTALLVPAFDADAPAWLNVVHEHDARSGEARWIAVPTLAPMPRELESAAPFERRDNAFEGRIYSGARAGWVASAPPQTLAPPRLDVVGETREGDARIVRARLWSPRGALRFVVRVPRDAVLLSISRPKSEQNLALHAPSSVRFTGIDAEGVVLEFRVQGAGPVDVDIADASAEMPAEFDALARARPKHYVPRGEGDVSVIVERVRL